MLFENMSMALHAIKANKMRSFLTMLGIIIGIGSVIAIVSIGDSMKAMIAGIYENVGVTRALVFTNWNVDDFRMSDYFVEDDIKRFKEVFGEDIPYVDNNAYVTAESVYGRNKVRIQFQGIDYNYPDVQSVYIIYGRALNEADVKARRQNVVLEKEAAVKLFGTADAAGKTFRATINKSTSEYYVVGVYQLHQTPFEAMMMGGSQSEAGFIPYTTISTPDSWFSQLNIYAREGINMQELAVRVRQYVARTKGRTADQITFYAAADEMGSWDAMMSGLSAAVGGIAAISLLVGGIGIMNIMLVSVTERTREIGIRKALGAKTLDVMIQFLTESAVLSGFGGVIGVIMGAGLVLIGGSLFGMTVVIKPGVVMLAVGFSALVGVFFGLYPASKAAKKDPIDALRYE